MRTLDDILIGFFIFFAIDRAIRLFGNAMVDPWARTKTGDEHKVENWKIGAELVMLLVALLLVFKLRRFINKA
jgi:protein-S-isoprenylcysteine O-methyltransferase Ste14